MAHHILCVVSQTKHVSVVVVKNDQTEGPSSHTSCGLHVAPGVTIGQHGLTVDATQTSSNTNDQTMRSNAKKLQALGLHAGQIQDSTESIGQGGSGSVYGMQSDDGKRLAVKRVSDSKMESRVKVIKEAQVLLSLLHLPSPYLCMPEGMYYSHNAMYFVFPRFATSVHELIEHCSSKPDNAYPQTFPHLVYIIIQSTVCGLEAMHKEGFAHCDVKTKNLLVRAKAGEGEVVCVLSDFGQSMQVRKTGDNDPSDPLSLDIRSEDPRMLFVNFPNKELTEDMHALWMMFDGIMAKLRMQEPPQSANAMSHTYRGFDIVVLLFAIRDKSTHADFEKIRSAVDVVQQMSRKVCDMHWSDRLCSFV